MPDFDPFAGGTATATAEPAANSGAFDPFASGMAKAKPGPIFTAPNSVLRTDPDAHWRNLYGGLEGLDKRIDAPQARAFGALDKISRNPEEDRARAINQTFVAHKLNMPDASLHANWDAVKSAFAKSELSVEQDNIPDKTLYGWIGQRLNPPEEKGGDKGEIKAWTWRDRLGGDAYAVKQEAGRLWTSIFKPFAEIPSAPDNLPDVWIPGGVGGIPMNPAVMGGVWNGAIRPLVEGLESPGGIATLGLPAMRAGGTAAKVAFKGISGLFAVLMGYGTYESGKELLRLRADPNSTTQEQVAALSSTVSNGAMALLGALGTAFDKIPERAEKVAGSMEGKPPAQAAEILRQEAVVAPPEAADALNQAAAKLDEVAAHAPTPIGAGLEQTAEGVVRKVGGEKISAAAIKTPDGQVVEGPAHETIAQELGGETPAGAVEGFVTNQGRFVDRAEASAIAQNAEQLKPEAAAKPPAELRSHEVTYDEPQSAFGQTSLKNAYGELDRVAYGFEETPPTERRNMAEQWARSGEVLERNPEAGRQLADRLLKDPNVGLTDDQSALLLRHKVGLQRALNEASDAMHDPNASPQLREEAAAQVKDLSQQLVDLLDAVNRRGSEWGREGRWRQALAREDYSFAAQETLLRAAKGGAELSDAERTQLNDRIKALQDAQAKLEAHISRVTAEPRTEAVDRTIKAMTKPPGTPRRLQLAESIREKLHAKAAESRKFLAGKVLSPTPEDLYHMAVIGADQIYSVGLDFAKWSAAMVGELGEKVRPLLNQIWDESQNAFHKENRAGLVADLAGLDAEDRFKRLSGIAQELARSHIAQGLKERDAVVDAVWEDVKKADPKATRRDVMDAISGYGQFKPLTHDQITDQLRDVKGQLQQVAKLEDMAAGQAPKKTGIERRTLSDEERRLVQQVEERKKAGGYTVTNPDAQLKSALQSAETRMTHEIADVENQLKNETPFDATKKKPPTSAKIEAMKKQLADLKERRQYMRDAMQPDDLPATREERAVATVKTNLTKQITSLEKQIATRTKAIDKKPGKVTDPEIERLRAQRNDLQKEFEQVFGKRHLTDEQRLNIWKANAQRRVEDLAQRLEEKNFEPPPKRSPVPLDDEAFRLKGELERIKQDFAIARAEAEQAKQPRVVRALKTTSDLARAGAISGYHTLLKLATFSLARFAEVPINEMVGAALRKLPGIRPIAEKANLEMGREFSGLGKFYAKSATRGMSDALETLKTGKSTLKAELGDARHNERPVHWWDYFGISHMAEKSPLLRGEFELRLEKNYQWAVANGLDVTSGEVNAAIRQDAFNYANRAILQENNQFSDWINALTRRMETANPKTGKVDITKQALATFVKTFLTKGIVKTPANYIMQTLERTPLGLAKGTAQTFVAHIQGIDKLTPEEANVIARLIKVGSVGSAVFLWGMIDASKAPKDRIFGGYYQPGDKLGTDDVGFGKIRVNGYEFPHLVTHNPLTESAQMGSTFYRVMTSKLRGKKGSEEKGAVAATAAVLLSLASEAPIASPITRMADEASKGEANKILWDEAAGLVPMFVANIAQDIDGWKSRKPESAAQAVEMNVPGLRGNVPETKAQKKRDIEERLKKK